MSLATVCLAVTKRAGPDLPRAFGGGRAHPQSVTMSPGRRALVEVCGPLPGPPRAGPLVSGAVARASGAASGGPGPGERRPPGEGWPNRMARGRQLRKHGPQTNSPTGSEKFSDLLRSYSTALRTRTTEWSPQSSRLS